MNATIRQSLARHKRRIEQRLDKHNNQGCDRPGLTASNIHYELAKRTRAISAGGIGLIHRLVKAVSLDDAINRRVRLFKLNLPYHESDHVLNIAYNVLAGGTCLEHLELLRNNEVYLDALARGGFPIPPRPATFVGGSPRGTSSCCRRRSTKPASTCGNNSRRSFSRKR